MGLLAARAHIDFDEIPGQRRFGGSKNKGPQRHLLQCAERSCFQDPQNWILLLCHRFRDAYSLHTDAGGGGPEPTRSAHDAASRNGEPKGALSRSAHLA